jgi:hypothetical protein
MKMKLFWGAATLPLFLMAVVVQQIAYQDVERAVAAQEKQQDVWLEKNRKLLAGVTVLRSPQRIETLAESDPSLHQVGAEHTVKVHFGAGDQP